MTRSPRKITEERSNLKVRSHRPSGVLPSRIAQSRGSTRASGMGEADAVHNSFQSIRNELTLPQPHLDTVSVMLSVQPLILFWASKCVILLVSSPSMAVIKSPIHKLAIAALLPGVTWQQRGKHISYYLSSGKPRSKYHRVKYSLRKIKAWKKDSLARWHTPMTPAPGKLKQEKIWG